MTRIPFGVDLDGEGAHPAAWRRADHAPDQLLTPRRISQRASVIDDSGLGFVVLPEEGADAAFPGVQGRLDSIETASFAAAFTSRIGLVAAVNAIHAEPYHLANQLNTLDWASHGRGGWLVGTDDSAHRAAGYGRSVQADTDAGVREVRDVVAAVRRLWDTWEDDVLLADEQHHRFLDLDRWHYADFVGDQFRIKGPGLLPRPPQGQLVVWSESFDPRLAPLTDIAVVAGATTEVLAERAAVTRGLGIPRRVAAVQVVLDARGEAAADRLSALDRWTPWPHGDILRITGSAAFVAERLAELSTKVDGIRLHPAVLDVDLPVLADDVLPRLDAAGVLRTPEPGDSLREQFGLARPVNVFENERSAR